MLPHCCLKRSVSDNGDGHSRPSRYEAGEHLLQKVTSLGGNEPSHEDYVVPGRAFLGKRRRSTLPVRTAIRALRPWSARKRRALEPRTITASNAFTRPISLRSRNRDCRPNCRSRIFSLSAPPPTI